MSPAAGLSCFVAGLQRAGRADARPFILGPALVSLTIISLGLYFGFGYINQFAAYVQNTLPSWLDFLNVILAPLLYLLGVLVGAWSFGLLAVIIGSPFLGDLAAYTGEQEQPGSTHDYQNTPWWQQILPALARELRKLRYHLPRLLGLLLFSLIPVLNTVAPILWLIFGAWMMAVQFCDYSTENRGESFTTTLQQLRTQRGAALGFGACVTVCMSIPLLNFLVAPVAVIGGTLLMHQIKSGTPSS